jgi:hypothetical protein
MRVPAGVVRGRARVASQIVAILKEGESGLPVAELLRKHGISKATSLPKASTLDASRWSGVSC